MKNLFSKVDQKKINPYVLAALVCLILLATLFRLYNLQEGSFSYDETASVRNVRYILKLPPFEEEGFFGLLGKERVPPFYIFYITPFYYLFQNSDGPLRLASVLWGIVTIPLIYCFGARLFNKKVGVIGALLLTFSPFHIYYSQELRHYPLFLFLSILVFYLAYRSLEENKNVYYAGMVIAAGIGQYTHTYMVFSVLIVNLYFFLRWKTHRTLLGKWILFQLIIGILYIPAFYHIIYHVAQVNVGLSDHAVGIRSLAGTFYQFTLGRLFFPTRTNLIFILVQAGIFGVGLLLGAWALWKERKNKVGNRALLFFLAVLITYITIWIISLSIVPLFDESRAKYLIFLLPFYYLLVAKGWSYLSPPVLKGSLISLAILINLIAAYPYYADKEHLGKEDFRSAARYVRHNFEAHDIVYHAQHKTSLPFYYYFDWQTPQLKIEELNNLASVSNERIWLVILDRTSGFDFSMQSLKKGQTDFPEQQNQSSAKCNEYNFERFHLAHYKTFPGKNVLTVCLFGREK